MRVLDTDHCIHRRKLILWHTLSYLFFHISLPLTLKAFSIIPCLFSWTIFFSHFLILFRINLPFSTHTVNLGNYLTTSPFIQSSFLRNNAAFALLVLFAAMQAKGFFYPKELQGDFIFSIVLSKKQTEQKSHWICYNKYSQA